MAPSILEPMPAPVEEKVEQLLEVGEKPRISAGTDMGTEGRFRGAWLVATERRLLIVAPETDADPPLKCPPLRARRRPPGNRVPARERSRLAPRRPPRRISEPTLSEAELEATDPEALTVLQVPFETVTDVKTHEYVGSGVLEVTVSDPEGGDEPVGTMEVLRYSRSLADKFSQVAEDLEALISGPSADGQGSSGLAPATEIRARAALLPRAVRNVTGCCPRAVTSARGASTGAR